MTLTVSREVRLRSRPAATPKLDDFEVAQVTLSPPGQGEVQVRNTWMSVDPYMRGRMGEGPSYVPPFELGKALEGGAVGTVVASGADALRPGDTVFSMLGWREAFNAPADALRKVDVDLVPPEAHLGIAGMTGLTAYVGLSEIAGIKAGETIFVSAAAGAVGSAVCQIARIKGATVIGSAGGPEKCAWLREIGVDHAIDYRATPDLAAAVAGAAPDGLDIYFDNVGGAHLEAALATARPFARFVLCGMISRYNGEGRGPDNIMLAVRKRLRLQGFIVFDHFDLMPRFADEMVGWIREGRVTSRQTVEEGLDRAPVALLKLFSGENLGKMLVRLA